MSNVASLGRKSMPECRVVYVVGVVRGAEVPSVADIRL
jgi:hypothetical protein